MAFRHMRQEDLGSFAAPLTARGYTIQYVDTPREDLSALDALAPDILAVLGGPVGVYQAADYPFLTQEIEWVKRRMDADKPVFGICLGSQIIAAAHGENVYKGSEGVEAGWKKLHLSEEGKMSPARHLGGDMTNMFHWHGDTFDLPSSCTLLASSAQYKNQIYARGKTVIATQCHPEITEAMLREWIVMFVDDVTGNKPRVPISNLRNDIVRYAGTLETQAKIFIDEWLGQLEE